MNDSQKNFGRGLKSTEYINDLIDKGELVDIFISLDLVNHFDTVLHANLMGKLS